MLQSHSVDFNQDGTPMLTVCGKEYKRPGRFRFVKRPGCVRCLRILQDLLNRR